VKGMLKLNGVDIPSFVKVNKVKFSVLPPIENNLLKVRGKAGLYNLGQDVGKRTITAEITIIAEQINGVMGATRELAEWLYHKEPVQLIINDEPDKYYLVLPDGETEIDEIVNIGKGEITFVCTEPFAFGATHEITFTPQNEEDVAYIDVQGTAETHPQIELTLTEDVTAISVITDNSVVTIGEEAQVTETPVNTLPVRLWDEMTDPASWTTALKVDGGTITGSFSSDGYRFTQANNDFGTGSTWHGASAIKSLPSPITDFEVEMWLGFKASKASQVGRIELYLLDQNNEQFGKMALKDMHASYNYQMFEARAGKLSDGHYFVADYGSRKGVWSNFNNGHMIIGRKGNKWYAHIGIWDTVKKRFHTRLTREWTDTKNIATNKLAKIQIHIGKYGNYEPYSTMYISDIKVRERLTLSAGEVPIIAKAGDVLLIDNESAIVYKNGIPFFEGLNPASKFFSFKKGINGIAISPAKADVKVTYTERWL
jgi:predicted phage tail component-like protein